MRASGGRLARAASSLVRASSGLGVPRDSSRTSSTASSARRTTSGPEEHAPATDGEDAAEHREQHERRVQCERAQPREVGPEQVVDAADDECAEPEHHGGARGMPSQQQPERDRYPHERRADRWHERSHEGGEPERRRPRHAQNGVADGGDDRLDQRGETHAEQQSTPGLLERVGEAPQSAWGDRQLGLDPRIGLRRPGRSRRRSPCNTRTRRAARCPARRSRCSRRQERPCRIARAGAWWSARPSWWGASELGALRCPPRRAAPGPPDPKPTTSPAALASRRPER